jgi:hypothetical protein
MKNLYLAFSWLLFSCAVVITSVATLQFLEFPPAPFNTENLEGQAKITTSLLHFGESSLTTSAEGADARAQIVANFLERYNSPLQPYDYYGAKIVAIADTHNIDFRLLPAIAMQESNLCKVIPPGSHNCLGFGIHERGTLGFESYEANFERAARELKRNYIDIGLTTPEEIQRKYTPSSKGSWAASVNQWMAEMRYDDRSSGRTKKTNADILEFVDN